MLIQKFENCYIVMFKHFTVVSEDLADAIACIFMQVRGGSK